LENIAYKKFVSFTINVFESSENDVQGQYWSIYSQKFYLEYFPSSFKGNIVDPSFDNESVNKYEQCCPMIVSKQLIPSDGITDKIQNDLEDIVCTGQWGELPDTLGRL